MIESNETPASMDSTTRLRQVGRRARSIGIASLLATTIAGTAFAGTASAVSPSGGGIRGTVGVPFTNGGLSGGRTYIDFPTRNVTRAAGYAGSQQIYVTYRIWQWSKATTTWSFYTQSTMQGTAAPGYSLNFPGWATYVAAETLYHADVTVTWYTSGGSYLGQTFIQYNATSDYRCLSPACFPGSAGGWGAVAVG